MNLLEFQDSLQAILLVAHNSLSWQHKFSLVKMTAVHTKSIIHKHTAKEAIIGFFT